MKKHEIIICGFGGQGIIFAGELLGRASVIAGLETAQSSSYGSESRGSACHVGIIISDESISYPNVREVSILIAMSQIAYEKLAPMVKQDGTIFYDNITVEPTPLREIEQIAVPATILATRLGSANVANVCMLSSVLASTGIIKRNALETALVEQSPAAFLAMNQDAIEEGYKLVL
tara:strand:- start:40 stop:567 length:528 start_codon:yes stop_codon:yes gene_type:complete